MDSCSASLSIQRLFSSPLASRVITTVILGVALSGALSACIRVHIDLATKPGPTREPGTRKQCDLKSQVNGARQQTGSWCWAASAQLVVEYLTNVPVAQCTLVGEAFEPSLKNKHFNCCQWLDGVPDAAGDVGDICEQGGWPERILEKRGIGFTKNDMSSGLDWDGLTEEICNDRPFIFVVKWSGGGRHTAVGGGFHTTELFGDFVDVYDHSSDGYYVMPEQEFRGNSGIKGDFTHEFDYIDIRLK